MVEAKPLVVITGVTGFLGLYVVREFINDGSYRLRGTMRGVNDPKKVSILTEALGKEVL